MSEQLLSAVFVYLGSVLLLCNIGLTMLNYKLYTEYFKDKSQTNRNK